MTESIRKGSRWRKARVYGIGAALTGIGAFGIMLIDGNSILEMRIIGGLVHGAMIWPFLLGPQLLIQWFIWREIRYRAGLSPAKEAVIANAPIAVILILIAGLVAYTTSPRKTFEKWLSKPVPASVRDLQRGQLTGMDFKFVVLKFKMANTDLPQMIEQNRFVTVNATDERVLKLTRQVQSQTGMIADLGHDCHFYEASRPGQEKRLVVNTNIFEVMFVLSLYN